VASGVQRVSVAGLWWRQAPHGGDPLWLASPPSSGRWQVGINLAAIYLADEEQTAWAEWYRMLAEIGLPPTHQMPRDLWWWTVAVSDIADLSTASRERFVAISYDRRFVLGRADSCEELHQFLVLQGDAWQCLVVMGDEFRFSVIGEPAVEVACILRTAR
jgi:hypothetical protein